MNNTQIIVAVLAAGLIAFAVGWSFVMRRREEQQRFLLKLKGGTRFLTFKELKTYYNCQIDFDLDGPFDPNRHGDLHSTLTIIEDQIEDFLKHWYS